MSGRARDTRIPLRDSGYRRRLLRELFDGREGEYQTGEVPRDENGVEERTRGALLKLGIGRPDGKRY